MILRFLLCLLFAGLLSSCVGYLIAFPALRLRGPYLAMLTFGFGEIAQWVFTNWVAVTRGTHGLVVNRPQIGFFMFSDDRSFYYIELSVVLILILSAKNILASKIGRAFV